MIRNGPKFVDLTGGRVGRNVALREEVKALASCPDIVINIGHFLTNMIRSTPHGAGTEQMVAKPLDSSNSLCSIAMAVS
jgi:hypothetical protein